ncbi:MAG: cupin domain-containing protein [Pseudomonadota bacterium]
MTDHSQVVHIDQLRAYVPPGHDKTRNVRLVEKDWCGAFEMVLGRLEPGGVAHAHAHDTEHQAMYVLAGTCDVVLDDGPPVACGPGTVVRIPPKVRHEVTVTGDTTLELLIVYSPPLPKRADVSLER